MLTSYRRRTQKFIWLPPAAKRLAEGQIVGRLAGGAKYAYLGVFFVLLAGFFHPLVSGASFEGVVAGTLVLALGLGGAILVYKASTANSGRGTYFGAGFGLMALSLTFILLLTGRF